MFVTAGDVRLALDRFGPDIRIVVRENVVKNESEAVLAAGDAVTLDHLNALADANIDALDVVYSRRLLSQLNAIKPERYRLPYASEQAKTIERFLRAFDAVSANNDRKRTLILAEDIYANASKGDYRLLARYGDVVTEESFAALKAHRNPDRAYAYRPNEYGVVVLIDLRPRGEDYLKRFYRNSALVTALVGSKGGNPLPRISPDMTAPVDVHPVDNHRDLLDVYTRTNARLIVVGDALSPDYKKALGDVKRYDRYARFMLAANADLTDTDAFFRQLRLNYHRNPWQKK